MTIARNGCMGEIFEDLVTKTCHFEISNIIKSGFPAVRHDFNKGTDNERTYLLVSAKQQQFLPHSRYNMPSSQAHKSPTDVRHASHSKPIHRTDKHLEDDALGIPAVLMAKLAREQSFVKCMQHKTKWSLSPVQSSSILFWPPPLIAELFNLES